MVDIIAHFLLHHHFHIPSQAGEIKCPLHKIPGISENYSLFRCPDAVHKHLDARHSAPVRIICLALVYGLYLAMQVVGKQENNAF